MLRRDFLSATFALSVTAVRAGWTTPDQAGESILDYGAVPDGRTLNTNSIQRTIDHAYQNGSGTVRVPAGTFLTGRIDLKSRVTLHLDAGSTLLASTSLSDYEGPNGDTLHRHLIFATDAEDVKLAGSGRIDGQGPSFWEPSGKAPKPPEDQWASFASRSLKVKESGRPSPMICFVSCQRLRIEDVRIENSPGWTIHTLNCDGVQIHGIAIHNPVVGPNTDGIDITGCQNVQVSNCSIDTGDDAICLKSEGSYGQEPRLVKNVVVTNCSLSTCCNGFKLGTSSEGGFENIAFSSSIVRNNDIPFEQRVIAGVALEVVDGGWIDGVTVKGIQMQRTRAAIFIRMGNRKQPYNYPQHGLRHVSIEDIEASEALLASSITGLPSMEVQNVALSNIRIENVLPCRPEWVGRTVPEKDSAYPEAWMFGMLPASGLYVRHARGLHFHDLALTATANEARPTVIFDDVKAAQVTGLASSPVSGPMPVVQLVDCQDVQISDSSAPGGVSVFLGVEGKESSGIVLGGDELRGAHRFVEFSEGASPGAVTLSGDP